MVGCIAGQWNVGRAEYLQQRAKHLPELVQSVDLIYVRHHQMTTIIGRARGPYYAVIWLRT